MDAAEKFRPSLVTRARKREVRAEDGYGHPVWVVTGNPSLSDVQPEYVVELHGRRYECACYDTLGGGGRRRHVCSHVMAVILYRQNQYELLRQEAGLATAPAATGLAVGDGPTARDRPGVLPAPPGGGVGGVSEPSSAPPIPTPPPPPPTSIPIPVPIPLPAAPTPSALPTDPPSPRDPMFGELGLPMWVSEIRPHQWQAVLEVLEAFQAGAKVVFVDAPTGSGKTLIGRIVSLLMHKRALYVCSDKALQDQFIRDFDAAVLKGRSNYPTQIASEATCADCTGIAWDEPCAWCWEKPACPYIEARGHAIRHPLAVLNTAYFLAETNGARSMFGHGKRGLVIVDECDVMEKELMGTIEVAITERRMKALDLGKPKRVTIPADWAEWVKGEVIPKVAIALKRVPADDNLRNIRQRKSLGELLEKLTFIAPGLTSGNWIFDHKDGKAIFRPVRVDRYGLSRLWQHSERWLLMSATIVSPDELAESLGLTARFETVRVPMTFPVENRRVHVAPVANMTNKLADEEWPKAVRAIDRILELHPDDRVLVHTVSYKLADYISGHLANEGRRPVLTYRTAAERADALAKYRATPGAVILAPSMDRGVDLKDDDCRVVVVAKLPFPNLGDKQVNARLHSRNGDSWYRVQTVRSLVQMTGRGVRSADDWATSYVLDAQFVSNLWKRSKNLFPQWWVEALDFNFPTRSLR